MLLEVLHYMGFTQNSLTLMDHYLSDRLQRVKLREYSSECRNIVSGVPQGSILRPLLFTLYTANFKDSLSYCKSHFYADDTQLYYSFQQNDTPTACIKINEDLHKLLCTSEKFSLSINPSKSQVMLFGSSVSCNRVREWLIFT